MSKIQVEEMKQRVNVMENTDALDKDEDDEDEDPFAKLNEDVENGEEENQPLIVLTMTAPEGLELIAKRTCVKHLYLYKKKLSIYLICLC